MSARVRFRFRYGTKLNGKREEVEALIRKPLDIREDGTVESDWKGYDADIRALLRVVPAEAIELVDVEAGGLADVVEEIERLGAKIDAMSPAFNERVQVAVPGFALMEIREVRVARDYCTDMLQDDLNDGWRILAICPQPDQRRPDYILGRTTPEAQP